MNSTNNSAWDPGSSAEDFFKEFLMYSFSIDQDTKGYVKFHQLIEK